MKGDFSRVSFEEAKHYTEVLLQQGRVQLDADWNEAAAIESARDARAVRDLVGPCGSPNSGFQIAARATLDAMDSREGWSAVPASGDLCVDYIDFLRGAASLHASGATTVRRSLAAAIDLSGARISFAVKVGTPPEALANPEDADLFSFFVTDAVDGAGTKASWAVQPLTPEPVGVWRVYTIVMTAPAPAPDFTNIRTLGFENLRADYIYHFDLLQRDVGAPAIPLKDIVSLDAMEDLSGWHVPTPGTGTITLDGTRLFGGRSTVKISGPGDGLKMFAHVRDLRPYVRYIVVTNRSSNPNFFLKPATGANVSLTVASVTTSAGWTTHVLDVPPGSDVSAIAGYGFGAVASGSDRNVAQVLAVLDLSGNFFVLGGSAAAPGRMYVDGIVCQKETDETYYSQRDYPEALSLTPADGRVDLVYIDVWQRHVTYVEDPELREPALGGPDTCTRLQTMAQVKVIKGAVPSPLRARLDCAAMPAALKAAFDTLAAPGSGTLSTIVTPPSTPANLCEIAPDADYMGLDNRLYRVEIHDPGAAGTATFKWSRLNGALASAVVEDVGPVSAPAPQKVRVERLGHDRVTALAIGDLVEVCDDLTELSDASYSSGGIPVRRVGELRTVSDFDPDANTITLATPLTRGYTVARHAKVRKWDGRGPALEFVNSATTPQLDFGDGVKVTFDSMRPMLSGDYWQFTARGITGQVELLNRAAPNGAAHRYCPLALIRWRSVAGGRFEIADIADCRPHVPALTELDGVDVGYDDGCCGLTNDLRTLAAWQGDVYEGTVDNVQQALGALCAREDRYLVLRYVSGDGQEGLAGETLPADLIVAVENSLGEPQVDVEVTFLASHGSLAPAAPRTTNANGEANVTWTLGTTDGLQTVTASLNTPQAGTPIVKFNARVLCADKICFHDTACDLTADLRELRNESAAAVDTVQEAIETLCEREQKFLTLRYISGDGQEGEPGEPLKAPIVVAVENVLGEPQANVAVDFTVITTAPADSAGSFSPAVATTDANGEARVTWTLGPEPGLNLLQASLGTSLLSPAQDKRPQITFNARGAAPAGGSLCTIVVGDGVISHGDLNGPLGLAEAIKRMCKEGGGTVCVLRGQYELQERIFIRDCRNVVIHGNAFNTTIRSKRMAFVFAQCMNVALRDLIIEQQGELDSTPLDGVVKFSKCIGVSVENCTISANVSSSDAKAFAGCLLIEDGAMSFDRASGALIRRCRFGAGGGARIGGIIVRHTSNVEIAENNIHIGAIGGLAGIDIDDDSDGALVIGNHILGARLVFTLVRPPSGPVAHPASTDPFINGNGSDGGIRIGTGCDNAVVSENRISGGRGFGIGLGSVDDEGRSRGGLSRLTVARNTIEDMALSGIGPIGFRNGEADALTPMTNDVLIASNEIARCAFGTAPVIEIPHPNPALRLYQLAGGIVLWMGENIRIVDNDVAHNGRSGEFEAPHPVCAAFVVEAADLVVARNRFVDNMSKELGEEPIIRSAGGIIVMTLAAFRNPTPTVNVSDNDIDAAVGPALFVGASSGTVLVTGNSFRGVSEMATVMVASPMNIQFTANRVHSVLEGDKLTATIRLVSARHVTFASNQCYSLGTSPPDGHVILNGTTADATGNHCVERVRTEAARPSLVLRGSTGVVVVGNVTSYGVRIDSGTGNIANLGNIAGIFG